MRSLAAITASVLGAGALAAFGSAISASAAAAASCTFDGVQAGGVVPSTVQPGVTKVAIVCTGLRASTRYLIADSSPLAGVLTNITLANETNLVLGTTPTALTNADGVLTTDFTIPSETSAPNTDGTCPPTQAQVDAGLTNCSIAVATLAGADVGDAALIYPDQPAPDATTLNLAPTSGPGGTTVSVSGSNWWGNALATVSPTITVDGVQLTTSSVSIPATTYTPLSSGTGSGGTLTGGSIEGTFTIPTTTPLGDKTVEISEPNVVPANDPPYSDVAISASSTFTVSGAGSAPLTITTKKLPNCHLGKPYTATLTATGGTLPYAWVVTSGSLPPGLTLSTSGVIAGTDSTQKGKFTFTVTVNSAAEAPLSIRCSGS